MQRGADTGSLSLPTFRYELFWAPPVHLGKFTVMGVEIHVGVARNLSVDKRLLLTNKVRIPLFDMGIVPTIRKFLLHYVDNQYFVGSNSEFFLSFANRSLHRTFAGVDAALNALPGAGIFFIDALAEQNFPSAIGDDDGNIRTIAFNVAHNSKSVASIITECGDTPRDAAAVRTVVA